jgi:DNA-binding CsgD family transcriptional regulator
MVFRTSREDSMTRELAGAGEPPAQGQHGQFCARIGDVLRAGSMGHFARASRELRAFEEPPATMGERALCRALLALMAAAQGDLSSARRCARQAMHLTARPQLTSPDLRLLRLARALAVNASTLVGDTVRAQRAARVGFLANDPESGWLIRASADLASDDAPASIQSYVRFIQTVHRLYAERPRQGPLTASEILVLEHVDAGRSAVWTAAQLGRSAHTVRTHLRNAYVKLKAHGRHDALTKAHALGLLHRPGPPPPG